MDRTIFATGTNRGIGKAIVERFAKEDNVTIIAHARKETSSFVSSIKKIEEENKGCTIIPCYFDLEKPEEIDKSLKELLKKHKKIDVLVNNAGLVLPNKSFLMQNIVDIKRSFEVNFFSQIVVTQLICRAMIRNKSGVIVNMSSITAFSGSEGQFEYSTAKAAIARMTSRLAVELAPYNVRVNAVAPGLIDTDMIYQMDDKMREKLIDQLAVKRLGRPEEIANTVYFLAHPDASYVNGQILTVNGGGNA